MKTETKTSLEAKVDLLLGLVHDLRQKASNETPSPAVALNGRGWTSRRALCQDHCELDAAGTISSGIDPQG